MTNEQQKAKELATLLTAFADGKQLQYFSSNNYWCDYKSYIGDMVNDFFIKDGSEYIRIKPETKRIPLTQQDLIDRIKEGKTMWIRHSITEYFEQIESFSPHCISLHSHINSMEYQYLMDFTFLDGTPCSKEVECE